MSKFFVISIVIVTFIVGIGVGFALSPSYSERSMNDDSHDLDLGKADSEYDLRFINAMIAHHMGAVEMAKDAKMKSKNPEIIQLSKDIISAQEKEISQMYAWKKKWFDDDTKVKMNDSSMNVNLGEYDNRFDIRFINAMSAHHEAAIEMAMDAQKKSSRNEILNLADNIIETQMEEVSMMSNWREELNGQE